MRAQDAAEPTEGVRWPADPKQRAVHIEFSKNRAVSSWVTGADRKIEPQPRQSKVRVRLRKRSTSRAAGHQAKRCQNLHRRGVFSLDESFNGRPLCFPSGLFNNRIRSWFASLSRSILIRYVIQYVLFLSSLIKVA